MEEGWDSGGSEEELEVEMSVEKVTEEQVKVTRGRRSKKEMLAKSVADMRKMNHSAAAAITAIAEAAAAVAAVAEAAASTSAAVESVTSGSNRKNRKNQLMPPPSPPPIPSALTIQQSLRKLRSITRLTDVAAGAGNSKREVENENGSSNDFRTYVSESTTSIELIKSTPKTLHKSLQTTKSSMTLLKTNLKRSATPLNINQNCCCDVVANPSNKSRINMARMVDNIVANNKTIRNSRSSKKIPPQGRSHSDMAINERIAITGAGAAATKTSRRRTTSRKPKLNLATKTIEKKSKNKNKIRARKGIATLLLPSAAATRSAKLPIIGQSKLTMRGRQQQQQQQQQQQRQLRQRQRQEEKGQQHQLKPELKVTKSKVINIVKLAKEMKQKANAMKTVTVNPTTTTATMADTNVATTAPLKKRGRKKRQTYDASCTAAVRATPSKKSTIIKQNNNIDNNNKKNSISRQNSRKRSLPYDDNNIDEKFDDDDENETVVTSNGKSSTSALARTSNVAHKSSTILYKRKKLTAYCPPSISDVTIKSKQQQQQKFKNDNNGPVTGKMSGGKRKGRYKWFSDVSNAKSSGNNRGNGDAYTSNINKYRSSPPLTRGRLRQLNENGIIVHLNTNELDKHTKN